VAAEHEQPAVLVGVHLTQVDPPAEEGAVVEGRAGTRPPHGTWAGIDDQLVPPLVGDGGVAPRRSPRDSEEDVRRPLTVGEVHGPVDFHIGRGQLAYGLVLVVVGEDLEPDRLPLHPPGRVLVGRGRVRRRTEKILVGAVADTGDADGGMNGAVGDPVHTCHLSSAKTLGADPRETLIRPS
jgi:hypothetical protein